MLRFQVQFLAALLALGVTCGALAATAPEPLEDAAVKEAARALVLKGDMRGFDALATSFRQSRERTPSGSWKLGLAYLSITQDLFAPADPRWEKLQQAAAGVARRESRLPFGGRSGCQAPSSPCMGVARRRRRHARGQQSAVSPVAGGSAAGPRRAPRGQEPAIRSGMRCASRSRESREPIRARFCGWPGKRSNGRATTIHCTRR